MMCGQNASEGQSYRVCLEEWGARCSGKIFTRWYEGAYVDDTTLNFFTFRRETYSYQRNW